MPDVPIGSLIPVTFPIEISNVGNTNVNYKIDIAEADGKEDAKGSKSKIFDIHNPTENVNEGEKQYLFCLFLEKKFITSNSHSMFLIYLSKSMLWNLRFKAWVM